MGVSIPPFMSASCLTRQQTPAELKALEDLRAMTRGGVLPSEDVVARIETGFPGTRAAGLARLLRARIKLSARDFMGAAGLLDAKVIHDHTLLEDYALYLQATAFEQAGKLDEARAIYEQLARRYPSSTRTREAILHDADILAHTGNTSAVPLLLKDLASKDDATALILTARAYQQTGDTTRAVAAYRRLYFYAPASPEGLQAATSLSGLGSTTSAATPEEALARADRFYEARRYSDALQAYTDAVTRFPATANSQTQLRRGISAANQRKVGDAAAALGTIPTSTGETRAEALYYLAQTYARAHQWDQARTSVEELRGNFPNSSFAPRAMVSLGQIAQDANNQTDALYFFRTAVNSYQGSVEVAQAQFNLSWAAHDAKNYQESSRLLTEHLAYYADKNTDNRGRAGYWAGRDSERAGKIAEARALYEAMQARYDANWYGYLAKQRLEALGRSSKATQKPLPQDSVVIRAVANLQTVTVAEETAGPDEEARIAKAEQLTNIGFDDWALEELAQAEQAAPDSPKVNLAAARVYRSQEDNVRALNLLKKSYPDYSQMKPEELTREEWDVFYPLPYWEIIVQESRVRNLDPFQVAGLIRQETVFNPRSRSSAKAYGLMQVLLPTATLTAKKYGLNRTITAESLYEPRLNIQLGTAYLRDQIDRFGRIEYVAAAYNAGPIRAVQWRASLPLEIDEWAEAVPFKETRGYVQGVVRNRLQYERLYDANGKFRPEVGTHAVSAGPAANPGTTPVKEPENSTVRRRRVSGTDEEE
jgi:soluble lytic murein transglycosylase